MKKKQKGLRRVCAWALAAAMILGGGITLPDTALTAEAEETVITGVNYAPGGTATASDEETADLVAANAIDGDSKTRWGTNQSTAQQARNLTVDLGVSRTFNRFVIEWERTNITNFEISISDDNISYTPVYTKNDSQNIESTTSDIPLQEAKTARYVKLSVSGYTLNPGDWQSVSLYEFKIIADVDVVGTDIVKNLSRDAAASASSQRLIP